MESIGARSADHVHLAARHAAVLRRQNALDDLNLRHGFDAHHVDLVLAAVLRERTRFRIGIRFGAVHGHTGAACGHAVHLHAAAAARGHAWGERQQIRHVAAVDRQLAHFLRPELVELGRGGRLDHRRLAGDGDGLRHGPELEGKVLTHGLS